MIMTAHEVTTAGLATTREAAVTYSQIAWLPLAGGLTLAGLIASWFAWRRRGAAAGLRGVAWSLLPLAAYLTGVIKLLWNFGSAISSFASSFVFSAQVWSGVIVTVVAVLLFFVSGGLRRRGRGRKQAGAKQEAQPLPARAAAAGSLPAGSGRSAKAAAGKGAAAADEDFGDVEAILRRRGIK